MNFEPHIQGIFSASWLYWVLLVMLILLGVVIQMSQRTLAFKAAVRLLSWSAFALVLEFLFCMANFTFMAWMQILSVILIMAVLQSLLDKWVAITFELPAHYSMESPFDFAYVLIYIVTLRILPVLAVIMIVKNII